LTKQQLDNIKNIHFVGIGGVSMSALALLLKSRGYTVSGSDMNNSEAVQNLEKNGIQVFIGHSAQNINNAQTVVYTAAVKKDNPELVKTSELNIPCVERAELLGCIMDDYECPVGICGTHGKTSVTSMISSILLKADKNPTIAVGATLDQINGNLNIGDDKYFIFESCEYCNSFLNFHPKISVFTNIEEDHLDFFSGIDEIIESFRKYSENTHLDGTIVYNADSDTVIKAISNTQRKKIGFGINNGDIKAENIIYINGCGCFDVILPDNSKLNVRLLIPGEHNIYNALAAIAAAYIMNIDNQSITEGLEIFKGARRRFEIKYRDDDITIIDDYAHHPSEIQATLSAAKKMGYTNVICIFQPHTYTRTKALLEDFAKALRIADKVILAKIYPAREKDIYNISSKDLSAKIEGSECFDSFDEIAEYIKENKKSGGLIITMGAGDIYKIESLLH